MQRVHELKMQKKKKKAKSWCLETAPKVKEFMYQPLIRAVSHNRGILNYHIVEIKTKALFKDQELSLISLNFGHACDKSKFEIIFSYRTPARLYDWSFYILVTAPEMAIPSILNMFLIYLQRYQHFHMHWVVQYQWKLSSVTMFTWFELHFMKSNMELSMTLQRCNEMAVLWRCAPLIK